MDFEWDPEKARSNQRWHGVSFEEATYVFEDLHLLEVFDDSASEERFIAIGLAGPTVLVVVYTERGNRIRIISARRATKREKDAYFQQAD